MRTTRQLSITLPNEMADMVRHKVESGAYASESEVIREGLRSLEARDAAIDRWLRAEVVPALEEYLEDPSQAISIDQAFDGLEERYRARKAKGG
jgi:antitoxin ParD1/3/4